MSSSVAAEIIRQADTVKNTMSESGKALSDLWVSRQKLEDLYKRLLIIDLEYALDKKVEQDLWNHAFKNQINALQTQAKDRQNTKRAEAQANLHLFLETASGFYLQFLQMVCSTFKLDLPFRRRSAAFGIIRDNTMNYKNIVTPKKSSCLYICCHCLVHLGDIARYRQQTEQAQTYYRHAANLSPNNGQPYNQLAILEASRGDKLSTVFYYVRSLAVRHPFPVAATNLEKFYSKLIKDTRSDFDGPNLTVSEIITAFLQFQALLHMCTGLERASSLKLRITSGLGSHIRSQTVSSAHLMGIVAISVFALHRARCDSNETGESVRKSILSEDEETCVQIHLSFTAKLLETMLQHTPKEDNKARDFLTLSAIKVLFDWIQLNKDVLHSREFGNTSIWADLCKLLNTLQWLLNDCNKASGQQKFEDTPLPEDVDLRCFQPLEPSYSAFNYSKAFNDEMSAACERDLRCQRMVAHGKWIAQDLPKLKLVIFQAAKSIRNQFSTQKVPQNTEGQQTITPRTSQRKNVAMQTIMKKKMQKRMEQDKGSTSPLSVISEESRPSSADHTQQQQQQQQQQQSDTNPNSSAAASNRVGPVRQAGVIPVVHHKGGNHKNLPPRLSAKAANSQAMSVSPRLQKKQNKPAGKMGRTGSGGGSQGDGNRKEKPEGNRQEISMTTTVPGKEPEAYPSLNPDNYPALVPQRSHASLVCPTDQDASLATPHASGGGFLARANWGGLSLGRDDGTSSQNMGNPPNVFGISRDGGPSPSSFMDSKSGGSRQQISPQATPRMPSPFASSSITDQQSTFSTAAGEAGGGSSMSQPAKMGFSDSSISPDFLAAIRSANQVHQQQQQQQQQYQQNSMYQQAPYGNSQQNQALGRLYSKQATVAQQPPSSLLTSQQRGSHPHGYLQSHSSLVNSGANFPVSQQSQTNSQQQQQMLSGGPLASTSQNMGGAVNTQQSSLGVFNMTIPPPSGSLIQPGLHQRPHQDLNAPPPPTTGSSSSSLSSVGGYQSNRGEGSNSQFYTKPPVGFIPPTGVVPSLKNKVPGKDSSSNHPLAMMSAGYLGVQAQPQPNTFKTPHTGLLYQNIPLPGSAGISSGGGNGTAGGAAEGNGAGNLGIFMGGQSQNAQGSQGFNKGGNGAMSSALAGLQDIRISSTFQGHATGTPKPDKQSSIPSQFFPPPPPQPPAPQQQSMIRAVMDPPFLQASGEYTLFSSNSSPAWPAMKTAPAKGSAAAQVAPSHPNPHMDNPGGLQGMWSNAGPSPLERLLEQQRNQRQTDG